MRELFAVRYDTMQALSDRARNYIAQCDQGAVRDLFGGCNTIEDIEEAVQEYIELDRLIDEMGIKKGEQK